MIINLNNTYAHQITGGFNVRETAKMVRDLFPTIIKQVADNQEIRTLAEIHVGENGDRDVGYLAEISPYTVAAALLTLGLISIRAISTYLEVRNIVK